MKKLLTLLLAAIMTLSLFVGCSLEEKEKEIADNTPVATVDGQVVLTWGAYKSHYNEYVGQFYQYYGAYPEDIGYTTAASDILGYYTEDAIVAYQARQQGFATLTQEQQTELDEKIAASLLDYDEYYRAMAEEEAAADATIDVEARIKELIAEEAVFATGAAMTYDEYIAWLKNSIADQHLGELLHAKIDESVTVSDADIEQWYNDSLASQQQEYDETPASYMNDQESVEAGEEGAIPVLYAPEGYARVMDILIAPTGELNADYGAKKAEMEELAAEYGEKSFADALSGTAENAARLAEIIAAYNALKAETDAMYDEYAKEARDTADAAYAELQAGTPFADVLAKYTMNEKFTGNELIMQKGALLYNGENEEALGQNVWSNAAIAAFKLLKAGEYSTVFTDDDGLHILYYVGAETVGARPFADMKETIAPLALEQQKAEEWASLLEAWKADASVVIDTELVAKVSTIALG